MQNLNFPREFTAQVLDGPPLIAPSRQYVYPQRVEEVESGALQLLVRPAGGAEFLATFALGFADPLVPTGVWSCPNPSWLCAAAGGYVYLVDTAHPENWQQVEHRPVLEIRAVPDPELLLFVGHHSILAWGREGKAWQSARLSSEGVTVRSIEGAVLTGAGWDLRTDKEFNFQVDLYTGARIEGSKTGD